MSTVDTTASQSSTSAAGNRWLILAGGVLVQLTIGIILASLTRGASSPHRAPAEAEALMCGRAARPLRRVEVIAGVYPLVGTSTQQGLPSPAWGSIGPPRS